MRTSSDPMNVDSPALRRQIGWYYVQEPWGDRLGDVDASSAEDALRYWLGQHEHMDADAVDEALGFGAKVNRPHTREWASARVGFPVRTLIAIEHRTPG
jgi:hypothetical protein